MRLFKRKRAQCFETLTEMNAHYDGESVKLAEVIGTIGGIKTKAQDKYFSLRWKTIFKDHKTSRKRWNCGKARPGDVWPNRLKTSAEPPKPRQQNESIQQVPPPTTAQPLQPALAQPQTAEALPLQAPSAQPLQTVTTKKVKGFSFEETTKPLIDEMAGDFDFMSDIPD